MGWAWPDQAGSGGGANLGRLIAVESPTCQLAPHTAPLLSPRLTLPCTLNPWHALSTMSIGPVVPPADRTTSVHTVNAGPPSAPPPYTVLPSLAAVHSLIETVPDLVCLYIHASWSVIADTPARGCQLLMARTPGTTQVHYMPPYVLRPVASAPVGGPFHAELVLPAYKSHTHCTRMHAAA